MPTSVSCGPKSMTDLRIVLRDVGGLIAIIGSLMAMPLLVSVLYREYYTALAFLISGAITACAGWLAWWTNRKASEPRQYHAYLIASAGWLLIAAFGMLPFLLAGTLLLLLEALFGLTLFRRSP